MGKEKRQMGRYLCKPTSISQRLDRISFKQTLPKMEVGSEKKNPSHVFTTSPILTSASGSEFAVMVQSATIHPADRPQAAPPPLPTAANGGQNIDFGPKGFAIVAESGLALWRNAEKLSEHH
jgi:hypothetical protein